MTYDYIIIGGGSAGCVMANRLTENPNNKVCLLEAGPLDTSSFIHNCNPVNMLYLMNSKKYNWKFYAEGNEKTGKWRFFWPRGKTLGGSSAINAMIYTRGHASDFDHWAELGNKGWDFESVLPYFKKSERQQRGKDEFHGVDGEMDVVDPTFHFPVSHAFLEACGQAGITLNVDTNGKEYEGVGFFQINQTPEGRRASASVSLLDPIKDRKNLTIITYAQIKRILFEGKTAVGIEYFDLKNGKKIETLRAKKEVILSAGVIGTPQILMLSGIGPKEELESLRIDVIHDLPGVGENLQDHPDIILRCRDKSGTSMATFPWPYMIRFLSKFYKKNKGPFVYTLTDAGGNVKSDPSIKVPDLQFQFAAVRMYPHGGKLLTPSKTGFVLHICHMRPRSRGRVRLQSSDSFADPIIDANYFDDEFELDAMVKGVKIGRKVLRQAALKPFMKKEEAPGDKVQSDDEIRKFILENAETVYHTAGSCKMGVDDMAVVDSELRVHGIQNLRVIDASIMPTITGSNIHGPTVMIAEKGAAMIMG